MESPGHLMAASDSEDAGSIITTSLLFMWDCSGMSSSGRDAFDSSHDEWCVFGSRDSYLAARVTEQREAMM